MSKNLFELSISDWREIHQLPGGWAHDRLLEVLVLAEYDDPVDDGDLLEMTLMALQDLGPREASEVVLQVVFGETMNSGVRQNSADDLEDDRPWEQFATVAMQAGIFDTVVLLQQAFPTRFGIPDAVCLTLDVTATDREAAEWLEAGPSSALLLRLLASGMPDDAVLKRLYEAEFESAHFPHADGILWRVQAGSSAATTTSLAARSYEIVSSWQWLGPLEDREPWSGAGWPDEQESSESR